MVITLDNAEMLVCTVLATLRNTTARSNGVADQRMDNKMDAIELDRLGIMAEMAWAKWKNTYPDLTASPRSGTYDAIFQGITIDIKATTCKTGRLLATLKKNGTDSDVYVLGIIDGKSVNFVGYAKAHEFLREENIGNLGRGESYVLTQEQLRKFKDG